jgi:hypothetical protein
MECSVIKQQNVAGGMDEEKVANLRACLPSKLKGEEKNVQLSVYLKQRGC